MCILDAFQYHNIIHLRVKILLETFALANADEGRQLPLWYLLCCHIVSNLIGNGRGIAGNLPITCRLLLSSYIMYSDHTPPCVHLYWFNLIHSNSDMMCMFHF